MKTYFPGQDHIENLHFQLTDGFNMAEKGKTYTFNIRVNDLSIYLDQHMSIEPVNHILRLQEALEEILEFTTTQDTTYRVLHSV